MRILVTGGAGFIGSHLCDYLLSKGNEVLCLDNLFTGSKKNIEHLKNDKNFEFIRHDIIEPIRLEVDQIYNLACPAAPKHYQHNPISTIKCSTSGVINMLGLAKRNNARILQTSTSEVYGSPEEHPQKETYWGHVNPIGIRSCYDEGKRVAECLMMDYHRQHKLEVRIARIFNTYGPKMAKNDGRVVPNFITQALENEEITIYGNGDQTRSFCYVDDMVKGLYKLMNSRYIGPMNLGNTGEMSMNDLAKLIIKLTDSNSKIIYKCLPSDDPPRRRPDISLAKEVLAWQPETTPEEGFEETIKYFKGID